MTLEAADTLAENSSASLGSMGSTHRCEIPALKPASARSRMASRDLGGKPLDLPARRLADIEQTIVQPVGAALPEFQAVRHDAIAAPVRRPRGRFAESRACRCHRRFEHAARD